MAAANVADVERRRRPTPRAASAPIARTVGATGADVEDLRAELGEALLIGGRFG